MKYPKILTILHLSGARSWGGNEQQLVDLIPELLKINCKSIVFGVAQSPLDDYCKEHGIEFISCKGKKINSWSNYRYLKTICRRIHPNVIHLHTSDSLTTFLLADLVYSLKTKVVFSKKGVSKSSSFLSKFKYNYSGIHKIICVSEQVKKDFGPCLSQKNQDKMIIINDAVNLDILNDQSEIINLREEYKCSTETFVIGHIANHNPAKDLNLLVDTCAYLRDNLNFKSFIVFQFGEFTKHTSPIREKIHQLKLENHIFLMNKTPNAYLYNNQFDCFLVTSEREGGPSSALEAMAFATPIVTTAVGIMPSIIENGKNGFISPIKEAEKLAKNIQTLSLLEKPNKAMTCQNRALIIARFNSDRIAKLLKGVYSNLCILYGLFQLVYT